MALTVREFETSSGRVPFRDWLATLDRTARARIQARVLRFESGYRIYFGQDGATVVLLLAGGTKATQTQDIRRARQYWREYLEEN